MPEPRSAVADNLKRLAREWVVAECDFVGNEDSVIRLRKATSASKTLFAEIDRVCGLTALGNLVKE